MIIHRKDFYWLSLVALIAIVAFSSRERLYYGHISPATMSPTNGWTKCRTRDLVGDYGYGTSKSGPMLRTTLKLPQGNYTFVGLCTYSNYYEKCENQILFRVGEKKEVLTQTGNGRERHYSFSLTVFLDGKPADLEFVLKKLGSKDFNLEQITIYRLSPLGWDGWLHAGGMLLLLLATLLALIALCRRLKGGLDHVIPTSGHLVPFLDGARGLAVMLVFCLHTWNLTGSVKEPELLWLRLQSFAGNGQLGVNVFFVLSAFTLTLGLYKKQAAGKSMQVDRFFQNRLLRIIPAYYLVVTVCLLTRGIFLEYKPTMSTSAVISTFSLVQVFFQDWRGAIPNHSVWWSISTEVQFYLLLPLLVMLFVRFPKTMLALCITVAIISKIIFYKKYWFDCSVLNSLDTFAFGIFAAHCYLNDSNEKMSHQNHDEWAVLFCALTALLFYIRSSAELFSFLFIPGRIVQCLLFSYVVSRVIYHAVDSEGLVNRILSGPVTTFIGTTAYGIYLIHVPVLWLLQKYANRIATGCGGIDFFVVLSLASVITFTLATFMYKYFEYPILHWGRTLHDRSLVSYIINGFGYILILTAILTLLFGK